MSFLQDFKSALYNLAHLDKILDSGYQERLTQYGLQRDYYAGTHRKQLKVRAGQADDNLAVNFTQLVTERGVSMLLGEGVEFDLPGEPDEAGNQPPAQEYIDRVWKANKKDILLHKTAQFGSWHGTVYLKIVPDGTGDELGLLPRLIPLDPVYMEIETMPEDIDTVLRYTMRYNVMLGGKDVARKEEVERLQVPVNDKGEPLQEGQDIAGLMDAGWQIIESTMEGGRWVVTSTEVWNYPFPPIVHWQNLPFAGQVYGMPDVNDSVIEMQDRINFVASNISKIIRYHAHPKTWGRGVPQAPGGSTQWGSDEIQLLQGQDAMYSNLEMQSDLSASLSYLDFLIRNLFNISRTADLASIDDKLGSLTNFALRVLFFDGLAKLHTKQELYGEALTDINHRLLVLANFAEADQDPGVVVWPDPIPTNEVEQVQALTFDLNMGLLSKQSAAGIRGYEWETEQERIDGEREAQQAQGDNIGAILLRNFERGNVTQQPEEQEA